MIRRLLFLIGILSAVGTKAQGLEFYREDLSFRLEQSHFIVDGLYFFCNVSNTPIESNIFYPFPIDSIYGEIDSILVEGVNSESLAFIRNKKGIYFKCNINEYGKNTIRIKYRQELLANKAEYILTTTKFWNKPFEIVNYRLTVAKELKIASISYPPDSISGQTYLWQKRDFMPTKDMIIEFEKE